MGHRAQRAGSSRAKRFVGLPFPRAACARVCGKASAPGPGEGRRLDMVAVIEVKRDKIAAAYLSDVFAVR